MMEPCRTPLAELETLAHAADPDHPAVMRQDLWPARHVALAPLAFGDTTFESRRIVEHPYPGAWRQGAYESAPVRLYRLRDAWVHSCAGIVAVDHRLVAETLEHVLPSEHGIDVDAQTGVTRLMAQRARRLSGKAVHALAAGAYNYYHWMIEVFCRLAPLPPRRFDDVLLIPPLDHAFQQDTLTRLGRPVRLHSIAAAEMVYVDDLVLIPSFTGYGYYPPPDMLSMADRLKSGVSCAPPYRRLYIHRLRSAKRRLENERSIIDRLERAGYESLDLDALPLDEQIRAFGEATHVVAAHGAGLTNVIFCRPGTAVCELQMDCYTNWLFRRLANLRGLRYGCVIGNIVGAWEEDWPHTRSWHMPEERLFAVLESAGFLAA